MAQMDMSGGEQNRRTTGEESSLIDPIYQRFVRGVVRAIGSTEFYDVFMDSIARAHNEFQFSNRKLIKTVDITWVDAIEESLKAFQKILASPRNVIREEELIVNVANARKAGSETVRHLAIHSNLVDKFDEAEGVVRPGKLMQRYREDSVELYENRLVFTAMEYAHHFVKVRYDALFEAMSDEFGAKLKINSEMDSATEHVHLDMFLHIKEIDSALETDEKNGEVFGRISRLYRVLNIFMNSPFAQQLSKQSRVKGNVTKTNVLKKNPDYKAIVKLWDFLRKYDDVGYAIQIIEQKPEVGEAFQQDIFRNIMFNYLILKGYLEDEKDRKIPVEAKGRKRTLKPKIIRQIVEELTEDYDLPDVEVRKVLIEALTKEDLMKEEAAERLRLVEEQERRKKEEEERREAEKRAEAERIRAEEEAERQRLQLEKEAEEERKRQARLAQRIEDRRRCKLFETELEHFKEQLEEQLKKRLEVNQASEAKVKERFEEAVRAAEEEQRRKREEQEQERRQQQEERARFIRQEAEEQARLAREAEETRVRMEQEAKAAAEAQKRKDEEALRVYANELDYASQQWAQRLALREQSEEEGARLRAKRAQAGR